MIDFEQLEIPGLPPSLDPPIKRCRRCWTVKPAGEFSFDRSRHDGLARQCRECDSDRHKERRRENGDLIRVRARRRYSASPEQKRRAAAEYRRTDKGKRLNLEAVKRYRDRNTHKLAAHLAVKKALAAGDLVRPDQCQIAHVGNCSGRIEAHHDDYSKPLEVRWLCTGHHQASHTKTRTYDEPTPNLFTVNPEPAVHQDLARALRRWPRARWIVGKGNWGHVTFCPGGETVELFPTVEGALAARATLDGKACCSTHCVGQHRVMRVAIDQPG